MTLAELVLEIRLRAGAADAKVPRALALERAARRVLEPCGPEQSELTKRILATLLGIDRAGALDPALLDAMTPEVVLLLDIILDNLTTPQECRKPSATLSAVH